MSRRAVGGGLLFLLFCGRAPSLAQKSSMTAEENLSGPDAHEHAPQDRGHLFGQWGGERQKLLEKGVSFDLQYVSDSLGNVRSAQAKRFTSWSRVRGTVDIDFGQLTDTPHLSFHITGLWQTGGNLGQYLGVLASPSGMSSANTFRLDSYWLEKRSASERITFRLGQFAGQDFYGAQHDAASFIFEPMGYALGNLNNTYETYDPPSTPAAELRVSLTRHTYVKSMVFAADRLPYSHNPTGFVPNFRGAPGSTSEIGWTPGQRASDVKAFDNIESRKGYTGLYQFGAAFNPGKFESTQIQTPVSGNYLLYGFASQALWRTHRNSGVGPDATAGVDWSPSDRSRLNQQTTVGIRYNELLPIRRHNTVAFGYVRSGLNIRFPSPEPTSTQHAENALELNMLLEATHFLMVQPVIQRFIDAGSTARSATVLGFRSKVDF